jgi:hypothetical protein
VIYIGMDDTDMPGTRGTGHLARHIAGRLARHSTIRGVSRHQLLRDPRVPMTKNNSANVIHVENTSRKVDELFAEVRELMLEQFIEGSDPGLCVLPHAPPSPADFGGRAKRELVTQAQAAEAARKAGAVAESLGGSGDGLIGAVAGVGLAAGGNDGRFVQIARIRELTGSVSIADVITSGVTRVQTIDGTPVHDGTVSGCEKLRPELIEGAPVILVKPTADGVWEMVRRD